MTKPERITYVRRMLSTDRGDDLERAEHAFRFLGQEEMQKQYGQSGQTCQQILDGYRDGRARHNEIADWLTKIVEASA